MFPGDEEKIREEIREKTAGIGRQHGGATAAAIRKSKGPTEPGNLFKYAPTIASFNCLTVRLKTVSALNF